MKVRNVVIDGEPVPLNGLEDLRLAIKTLGTSQTLTLNVKEELDFLEVTSVDEGQYIVDVHRNQSTRFVIDPSVAAGKYVEEIVIGGQQTGFAERALVGFTLAVEAAAYFLDTAALNPKLTWVDHP